MEIAPYLHEKPGNHPPYLYPDYGSTVKRAPRRRLTPLEQTLSEVTGPGAAWAGADAADLTRTGQGEPLGERIIVAGRVLDENGRAVPGTVVELWQANSAGRYRHERDQHDAPLDPNFLGAGHVVTDAEGNYRFLTVKPGAYPWRNHPQRLAAAASAFLALRPGLRDAARDADVFPGRPAAAARPHLQQRSPDVEARVRLIAAYRLRRSAKPEFALGYRFDIVLRGRAATPMER